MKKRTVETILCVAALCTLVFIIGRVGWHELHYSMNGTVTRVEQNEVFVVDEDGEVWSFFGDGFNTGDKVVLTMDTNGTDLNKTDDEITNVKPIN